MHNIIAPAPTANEIREAVVYFYQLGNLLADKRFHAWFFDNNDSRFTWATPAVFDKLRADCMLTVRTSLPYVSNQRRPEGVQAVIALSDVCIEAAANAAEHYALRITQKEQRITFSRGADVAGIIRALLMNAAPATALKAVCRPQFDVDLVRRYAGLPDAIVALSYFARAHGTLSLSTGVPAFEAILAGVTTEWVTSGYPHDLLVHDACCFANTAKPVIAWLYREEYCSTWVVCEGEQVHSLHTHKVVRVKAGVSRAA